MLHSTKQKFVTFACIAVFALATGGVLYAIKQKAHSNPYAIDSDMISKGGYQMEVVLDTNEQLGESLSAVKPDGSSYSEIVKGVAKWNSDTASWPTHGWHKQPGTDQSFHSSNSFDYSCFVGVDRPQDRIYPLRIYVENLSGEKFVREFTIAQGLTQDQYHAIHDLLAPCHQQCQVGQPCPPMEVPVITGTDANGKPMTKMKKLIQYVDYYKKSMFVKTVPE